MWTAADQRFFNWVLSDLAKTGFALIELGAGAVTGFGERPDMQRLTPTGMDPLQLREALFAAEAFLEAWALDAGEQGKEIQDHADKVLLHVYAALYEGKHPDTHKAIWPPEFWTL